jgi:hypothetical protein
VSREARKENKGSMFQVFQMKYFKAKKRLSIETDDTQAWTLVKISTVLQVLGY